MKVYIDTMKMLKLHVANFWRKMRKNEKQTKNTTLEARFCRVSTSMSTILYTSYEVV